jgi:BASS family bile acid:Na+ symporter
LGTAQRNIAAALVVGSQSFSDPQVIVMVIVVATVGFLILMPVSRALGKANEDVTRAAGGQRLKPESPRVTEVNDNK